VTFEEAFQKVRAFAATADPALSTTELLPCGDVRGGKTPFTRRSRAFMHTGHLPSRICYAPPTRMLALNYIVGILLHEFGHLGSGGGEVEADTWVAAKLGIALEYKGKLCLEWVDDDTARRILGL
jgi:hypothetical protein